MSPHPLTNFEIRNINSKYETRNINSKYYKNEPIFNGVFSRNNLPKKKKNEGWGIYNKS